MRIKHNLRGGGHLFVTSGAVLALLVGLMLFAPGVPDFGAMAVEEGSGGSVEDGSKSGIATLADTSAGISVPSSIDFTDVVPTDAGATTTATASVGVTTTNSSGYSLYLYTAGEDNSLKPVNPANSSSIAATNTTSTLNDLTNNTWGYNLGTTTPTTTTNYTAVPTSNSTPIQTKDTSTTNSANDTYTLTLGAKVDTNIPSGTYSNTLTLALVADPGGILVTYDANGGYYNNVPAQTTQKVGYTIGEGLITKIAKTSNISDTGVQSGGYGDDVEDTQTVTIPGAESLTVTVSYQTESTSYDWLAIYDGSVTPSSSNYSQSITGKLGGTTKVNNKVYTIPGDTAQFYFRSDGSSSNYYGYYATVEGNSTTITPSSEVLTPTRPGYYFWGWYKDSAGTPGNEFTPDASLQATTVYAKWGTSPAIQNFTLADCQAQASNSNVTVADMRDNNTYTVRYINGACWMAQNLRLSGGRTLTPADSNVSSNWEFPNNSLKSGGTNYIGNSYTEAGFTIDSNTSYGGYYNYCAASAGTVCSETRMDATQDICPKGWRLPTHDEQAGITSYASAFSPVYSGNYYNGSLSGTGSRGRWWSATAYDRLNQYYLYYGNGSLYASDDYCSGKFYGVSVRCIRSS